MKYKALWLYKDRETRQKYGTCLDCYIDRKTMALYCNGGYLGQVDPKDIKRKTLKGVLYEISIYIKKIMG